MKNRILITGGAGFIGSHLTSRLLNDGSEVTVVDSFDPFYPKWRKLENIETFVTHPRFRLVEADIRDLGSLKRTLDGRFDVIVHLAAKAGVRPSIEDPVGYQQTNVAGTQNLLELARQWGVGQFVFASSSSVYGVHASVPWRESDAVLRPISPYAVTKVTGELLGHVYSHLYGIRFLALRLFTVYGPRQRPDLAIHKFAEQILKGELVPLYGNGETKRDYTFVDDVVSAFTSAISYQASKFEIANISNERTVTLRELVKGLEEALGMSAKLEWLPEQPGDVPQTWGNISRARHLFNYSPKTTLAQGLREFSKWFLRTKSFER